MNDKGKLYYGAILVSDLQDLLYSDRTWHAVQRLHVTNDKEAQKSIHDFIKFCEAWNLELARNPDSPPSVSDFDRLQDLISSKLWFVVLSDGTRLSLASAPVFLSGGIVSWRALEDNGTSDA